MSDASEAWIRVHVSWCGWRSAEIRVSDLEDVHWYQPAGAPHPLVHAFVRCTDLSNGELDHRCDGSMRLRVCVLKHHVVASTYAELARRAEARDLAAPIPSIAAVHQESASSRRSS